MSFADIIAPPRRLTRMAQRIHNQAIAAINHQELVGDLLKLLTIKKIAEVVGVSHSSISRIYSGKHNAGPELGDKLVQLRSRLKSVGLL